MAGRPKLACCLRCHFGREERRLFHKLPPGIRQELLNEHVGLLKPGTTGEMIEAHAEKEMAWFRIFCTPEEVAWVEADHEHLAPTIEAMKTSAAPQFTATATSSRLTGAPAETRTKRCCCSKSYCKEVGCHETSCIPGLGCKIIDTWDCKVVVR